MTTNGKVVDDICTDPRETLRRGIAEVIYTNNSGNLFIEKIIGAIRGIVWRQVGRSVWLTCSE